MGTFSCPTARKPPAKLHESLDSFRMHCIMSCFAWDLERTLVMQTATARTCKQHWRSVGNGQRGIEGIGEIRVAHAVSSPSRGAALAVDGLVQQRVQHIGVPGHPRVKALRMHTRSTQTTSAGVIASESVGFDSHSICTPKLCACAWSNQPIPADALNSKFLGTSRYKSPACGQYSTVSQCFKASMRQSPALASNGVL